MRSLLKLFAGLLSLLLFAFVAVFVYLTQVLDPNDLKSDIETLAEKQGVPLKLHGALAWQFFPQLGLRVQEAELATPGVSLLKAQELSASVAVMPLLQGQVQVAGVLLKGARIHALRGPDGQDNWTFTETRKSGGGQAKRQTADASSPEQGVEGSTQLSLAVERFVIEDAQVLVEDLQANTRNQLEAWDLTALNINFTGQPFLLEQNFVVRLDALPALRIQSKGELSFDANAAALDIPSLLLTLATLEAPDEQIQLNLSGSSVVEPLRPSFHLSLLPMNPVAWLKTLNIELPPMAAADALTRIALEADLSGANQAWQFSNIEIHLDETRLKGDVAMAQGGALKVTLKGDKLNLDRYLSPVAEPTQPTTTTEKNTPASPLLSDDALSLEGLKALALSADLAIQQLQVSGLTLADSQLRLEAQSGDVRLEQLVTDLYDGRLSLKGRLDARQPVARVSAQGGVSSLSLAPLLNDLSLQGAEQTTAAVATETPEPSLAGQTDIEFDLMTQGKSLRDWQLGLQAQVTVLANQLTVHELDVEQGFCELAASLSGKELADQSWKGLTNLDDLRIELAVAGTDISLKQLQAGVEHFQLKGRGISNYLQGNFDIKAEALVAGQKDVARGCQLADRWRNRELPLRCAGNFDSIGARTCGPDRDRVDDLLRDEAKARAKEKVGKKINKLEDKLKKKLGDDLGGQLLKGLFGR